MKLLVVGFDALDYNIYKDHCHINDITVLPFEAEVASTGPSWTSIYTGLSVVKHAVVDHWGRESTLSLGFRTTPAKTFVWDILNKWNYSVELFNLPVTFPPRSVNKYMLSGLWTPENSDFIFPVRYKELLSKDLYRNLDLIYQIQEQRKWMHIAKYWSIEKLINTCWDNSRICIDNFLLLHEDSDFCFIQFSFVDRIGHAVCGYDKKPIEDEVYDLVRKVLDYLLAEVKYDNLMIISDHGYSRKHHGSHKDDKLGVFAYKGEHLCKNSEQLVIQTVDFCPTVLYLYDIPIPLLEPRMDGNIIYDIFVHQELSTSDKELMESHLRELGYID